MKREAGGEEAQLTAAEAQAEAEAEVEAEAGVEAEQSGEAGSCSGRITTSCRQGMATASEASTANQVPSKCTRRPDHAAPPTRGASQPGTLKSWVRSKSAATSASAPAKLKTPYLQNHTTPATRVAAPTFTVTGDFGPARERPSASKRQGPSFRAKGPRAQGWHTAAGGLLGLSVAA